MVKLLSIDSSTSCSGWATFINGMYNTSGVIDCKKIKDNDTRMKEMCTSLLSLLDKEMPDIVVVELTAVLTNANTQRKLTMILGVVYGWVITHTGTDFYMLRPAEWRSKIKNKNEKNGRKRDELKQWSIAKVKELFNVDVISDDQSDAILIGQALINMYKK